MVYFVIQDPRFLLLVKFSIIIFVIISINNTANKKGRKLRVETFFSGFSIPYEGILKKNITYLAFKIVANLEIVPDEVGKGLIKQLSLIFLHAYILNTGLSVVKNTL